jgi:hypothetical protein
MAVVLAGLMAFVQVLTPDGAASPPETPVASEEPVEEPAPLTPREYLFATHASIATRMDCVIARESRWIASAVNSRSGAAGLAQFLPSTWRTTPQARAGASVFDAFANIDGAAWLAATAGWRSWTVVQFGYC